jgi:peptidoglycan hydrolase-like protein with peptidoglycan-binding domain
VEYLQESLNLAGFGPLSIDGSFGPGTHRALIAFQTDRGLQVDGTAGNQTWAALRGETPQAPSTDGRDPHTYVERGPEARWFTETGSLFIDETTLTVWAVSTGDTPIAPGQFPATARITAPSGQQHVLELTATTEDGTPAGEGGFVNYVTTTASFTEEGEYTVEVYLPAELGGDETVQQFTLPQ